MATKNDLFFKLTLTSLRSSFCDRLLHLLCPSERYCKSTFSAVVTLYNHQQHLSHLSMLRPCLQSVIYCSWEIWCNINWCETYSFYLTTALQSCTNLIQVTHLSPPVLIQHVCLSSLMRLKLWCCQNTSLSNFLKLGRGKIALPSIKWICSTVLGELKIIIKIVTFLIMLEDTTEHIWKCANSNHVPVSKGHIVEMKTHKESTQIKTRQEKNSGEWEDLASDTV